ncbi:uncharacterized protein LOC144922968 [Branchiostoma floridae x Branchiostoma belcheri]
MKKAVGVALPLVMILAVAVYLAVTGSTKKESSNQGHRVIKRSLVLPSDLQEAMRAASAEDAPAYEKNKRFIPAIANLAGNILSKADSVDTDKLTDTVQKLGSMKNMAPDIMADSVQKEAEVTAEIEKNVAQQTISQLLDKVEHDHDKKEEGGEDGGGDGGGEENEIKAEIDFVPQKGMVEEDLFAPPGMNMKMDIEENPQADDNADDMSEPTAFSYPLGMGGALMDGCFGTDYTPEDPCYNQKTVQPACGNMMEGCAYIGVGFDGRGQYSSASRKKTVIQRYCAKGSTYHNQDVPDNMNVHGIYDTEVTSYVFDSREAYRHSLQQKAGVSFSGWGFQASVDSAWGGSQESQKQSFMSLIECDVIRYEIFLDEVTPDSLSLAFLRDFLSLPKNFINGKAKLQEFIIRYGTHYIKSAKFGGSFRLFKTQEASKTSSLTDFSIQAQASYNGMFSAGGHYGRQESSEQSSSSKSSSSHVMVEGGEQEVAAVVSDFYTTNFKETFTEWLKSIPSYPKPIEMFMGTMSELLNLNFKLLFPFDISDAADGCFANNLRSEPVTGRKYYEVPKLVNSSEGGTRTIKEKRYCDVTSIDQFQVEMDQKRLALERAIAIYMEEGPIPTADFHLRGGKPGCQAEALTVKAGATGVTHPSWTELINGDTYKIIFDLPEDINYNIKRSTEAYVVYAENRWNCHVPGTSLHVYNSRANGGSGDTTKKKVSCFGFVMTYKEETGKFAVTSEDQTASTQALGDLPRNYADGIVGRAEYISPLEHSQKNSGALSSIVEAPCTVKWSNSYQIKPADEGGKCLYFIGASKGDMFVVFSSIPKDKTTWYHLQISFQGVALYKGMRLVKYEGAKNARSLGDSKLFQPYFICLDEDMDKQQTYIKYGIGSDTSEKGLVYMVYLDESTPLGIRFYSFGSGEADVEIMDARVIEGGATGQMECTGGTVLKDGMCVEDCHPECNGCIPSSPGSKLDTECRMCRHFSVSKGGSIRCVASCPADTKLSSDGVTCELTNPPQDCADLFAAGTRQSGTYTVGEPSPYRVYCDMSFLGGGWTVLQRRQDGSVDFAKNWADYQQGFGDPNAEFWLGLDNIHTLTTAKSNILRIELENFNGERRYARYSSFSVGDASGNYVVSISGYSGDAGDSLTNSGRADINGRMFSTIDRDNDGNSVNCASSYSKGGWWYPLNCGESFLNGRYNCHESSVNCGNSQGVVWSSWGGASYLLKKTTIMIRPAVGFTDLGLNLAFEKPTAQSSTGYGGVAERAVDGNTDPNWGGGSCTHTNQEGTPWWRVDLGTSQAIGSVVVFNRNEQSQRLNNFRVHVGDSTTVTSNPQCGGNHAATGKQKITVDCDGRRGRYVGISIPATTILTLCEVQVYGAGIGKK